MAKKIVKEEATTETPIVEEKAKKVKKVKEDKPAKVEKAAKADKKAKEPVKPTRTEAKAVAYNVHSTPRKIRLVIDMVRGKDVVTALNILNNTNKMAVVPVMKLIRSAYANATNNFNMNGDALYIAEIYATDGLKMKRFLPRAKGSASGLVKRLSHIYVTLKEKGE